MNLTFYFALARIPLGIAVALEFTGPMAVAIFTSKYKMDYLWALLAGFGIYLLLPLSGATNLDFVGVFWALAAGFFWALYIVFGKKAGNDFHGGLATTIGMTFAAMVAIPAGVIAAGPKLLDVSLWPYGFGVALLSSAIPYSLEMLSLKSMPTKTFGVLMSLEPAIAAFAGLLFLGEELSITQWIAILCVILSSLGSTLMANEDLVQA
jgi:inner membrane transporter RhtA